MQRVKGGIDLGGTKIQAVIVDEDDEVVAQARHATPIKGGPPDVVAHMVETVREATEQAGVKTGDLQGVGVGSPGAIDAEAGVVAEARNLPGWDEPFAMGPALEKALDAKVRLGNDVQVAVDGEFALGAGRDSSSLLGVWWGTGVGGGIILDGKPWLGRGAAGEIGHIVVRRGGARCPAAAAAAWRPTPGVPRWRPEPASSRRRATTPSCSRSWRSTGAPGSRAASGPGRWRPGTRWPSR